MKRYNLALPENTVGLTYEPYLKLAWRKYNHAKNIILTFAPDPNNQFLADLHSEYNAVAWEGYARDMNAKEFFRLADRKFYALLRHLVGLRRVQIYENGHYTHRWVSEIELENQTQEV